MKRLLLLLLLVVGAVVAKRRRKGRDSSDLWAEATRALQTPQLAPSPPSGEAPAGS